MFSLPKRIPYHFHDCVILCTDAGLNSDTKEFTYTVDSDTTPPEIIRVYSEGPESDKFLKIITSEDATCVWNSQSSFGCTYEFDEGVQMNSYEGTDHYTDWDSDKTYYIKCKDSYGNPPFPNECSIVVKPFDLIKLE